MWGERLFANENKNAGLSAGARGNMKGNPYSCRVSGGISLNNLAHLNDFCVPIDCLRGRTISSIANLMLAQNTLLVRFLKGEMQEIEHCCVSFQMTKRLLRELGREAFFEMGPQLDEFARRLVLPDMGFVMGLVDGWAKAKIFVKPETVRVTNAVGCHFKVVFSACIQMDTPVVPKPLDFFERGVKYNIKKQDLSTCEITLGLMENCGSLYVGKNGRFLMKKPADDDWLKKILASECSVKGLNVYDFARLASVLCKLGSIAQERFSRYNNVKDFFEGNPGALPPRMAGPVGFGFYSVIHRACAPLAENGVSKETFEKALPELVGKLGVLEMQFNRDVQRRVINKLRFYFQDLLNFYENEVKTWSDKLCEELVDRVYEKVCLDPLSYCEDKCEIVAQIARHCAAG